MTLKLYDWHNGPYPARVRVALAEKGLQSQVHFISVDLRKGEHKTEEFRAKNYSGTLPVLELADGTLIVECTAITEYLDALDGTPMLTGRTAREKGIVHMMSRRAELEVLDAISIYFHHATPGLGPHVESTKTENGDCTSATRPCAECATSILCCGGKVLLQAKTSRWPT